MKREHTYHIWPKGLDFAEKLALLPKFAAERKMSVHRDDYQRHYVTFNQYESASTGSFDEFLTAIKKNPRFKSFDIEIFYRTEKREKAIKFQIRFRGDKIEVAIESSDDDLGIVAHSFIREEFGLSNPSFPDVDQERAKNLQATIFLGRHFDDDSEQPAARLREFLLLHGFKVVEGDKYHAEPIPEKVKKLIDEQAIYIGLVIGNREHLWLVAESAYARGKGMHIIMIVEEGSNFHPSIHGRDYEQIAIEPGHVEQSFIKLLQEFRSVGINGL